MPHEKIYYDNQQGDDLKLRFYLEGNGVTVQMSWDDGVHAVNLDVADLEVLIEDLKLYQDLLFEHGKS